MTEISGGNFDQGMAAWQDYQQAPWGKLRYRIAEANLAPHLPPPPAKLLDLGGGNGHDAVPLAKKGYAVSVVDFSAAMLAQGQQLAAAAEVADLVSFQLGDATQLSHLVAEPTFDVVLCHNVLQYVADVTAVLTQIHQALKPGGILSLMITNPHTETFAFALRDYDLQAALDNIGKRTKHVDTFDATIQRHTDDELITMLESTGFTVEAQYGIRAVCDFMADNDRKFDPDFYKKLEELEMAVRDKRPYVSLARFYHFVTKK